jgi:surface antigen
MRSLLAVNALAGLLMACSAPVASQQVNDVLNVTNAAPPPCRMVTGTADIDGTPQQISGLACLQPDGTWQIVQGDGDTLVYPVAWPDVPDTYAGPWYGWWPPVFVGGSFVFVDHFHHFHHMDHVYPGRGGMHPTSGVHGGFHGGGAVWSGMGSMSGGHHR